MVKKSSNWGHPDRIARAFRLLWRDTTLLGGLCSHIEVELEMRGLKPASSHGAPLQPVATAAETVRNRGGHRWRFPDGTFWKSEACSLHR